MNSFIDASTSVPGQHSVVLPKKSPKCHIVYGYTIDYMAHRILKSVPKHPLQYPKGTINHDFAFSSCQLMLTSVFILKPHIPYMTQEQSYKTDQRHTYLSMFLRELRRNSGYTQDQVAKSIKLSRYSLSRIENNGFFRIQHLYLLADFYEIPLYELFADIE